MECAEGVEEKAVAVVCELCTTVNMYYWYVSSDGKSGKKVR